jgi:hypothetical protein
MDLVYSTSNIHYITVFRESQPFGTNSRFPVQFAKPQISITGFNFFMQTFMRKREKGRKAKSQQGCKRMAIIRQCIFCMIRELHPAPSVALFASFGTKWLSKPHHMREIWQFSAS